MRGKEKRARAAIEQGLNALAHRSPTTRAEFVRRMVEEAGANPDAVHHPLIAPLQTGELRGGRVLRRSPEEAARLFLADDVRRFPITPKCPWCGDPIARAEDGSQARCGCGLP